MWGIVISILMAILIGFIGDALVRSDMPGGLIGSMLAGFAGAWIGAALFGSWGPIIGGFAVIPAIIGTMLFVFILGLLGSALRKTA